MYVKKVVSMLMAVCMLAALLCACGTGGDGGESPAGGQDVLELKLSHNNPAITNTGVQIQTWADEVNAASDGTIQITVYPSDSLGASSTFLDMLDTGITDLEWASTVFCTGQFNYLDAFYLPMMGIESCQSGTNAFWDIYEQYPEVFAEEFADYMPLIMYSSNTGVVGSNTPIHSPSDFAGLSLRTVGGTCSDFCQIMGASPVSMGPGDLYTNLEKSVVSGYTFEWGGVNSFNLDEVTDYYLDANMFRTVLCIWITRDLWDSLSDQQREAFESNSFRDGSLKFADMYQKEGEETVAAIQQGDSVIYRPTDEEYEQFLEQAELIWDQWAEDTKTLGGVAPTDYLESVRASIEANNKDT